MRRSASTSWFLLRSSATSRSTTFRNCERSPAAPAFTRFISRSDLAMTPHFGTSDGPCEPGGRCQEPRNGARASACGGLLVNVADRSSSPSAHLTEVDLVAQNVNIRILLHSNRGGGAFPA